MTLLRGLRPVVDRAAQRAPAGQEGPPRGLRGLGRELPGGGGGWEAPAPEDGGGEDSEGGEEAWSKNSRGPKHGKTRRGKLLGDQVKYAARSLGLGREAGLTTPRRAFRSGVREAAAA